MFSKTFAHVVLGSALLVPALAHMNLMSPTPLRHINNKYTKTPMGNYDFPLKKDGSNFPCKGMLGALGTDEGQSVATWPAGSQQNFALEGSSAHYGGSCQLSLSYDSGKTFKVIASYIGSCPHRKDGDQSFNFNVPSEAPSGDALFSWSWNNREQEFFQNCAVVTISGGGAGISHLPDMLASDIGNGCDSPLTKSELKYPDPGPVVVLGDGEYPVELPSGNCGGTTASTPSPSAEGRNPEGRNSARPQTALDHKPTTLCTKTKGKPTATKIDSASPQEPTEEPEEPTED